MELSRLFGQSPPETTRPIVRGRPYLAFDIETAKITPVGADDLMRYRPLGITCAATLTQDGTLLHWYSKDAAGVPAAQMTAEGARQLVRYLQEATRQGAIICTWNGLGFDFDILAEESGMIDECRELALNHIDMMFHFFCLKGFAVGIDKVCQGMGIQGKPPGMKGALAPQLWARGKHREVLDYVGHDVQAVLAIAQAVDMTRSLTWVTGNGDRRAEKLSNWLTAREATDLPLPDTTWMKSPWPRSKFIGWTGYR